MQVVPDPFSESAGDSSIGSSCGCSSRTSSLTSSGPGSDLTAFAERRLASSKIGLAPLPVLGPIDHGVVGEVVKEGVEVLALVHLRGLAWLAVHFEMNFNSKPLGLGKVQHLVVPSVVHT